MSAAADPVRFVARRLFSLFRASGPCQSLSACKFGGAGGAQEAPFLSVTLGRRLVLIRVSPILAARAYDASLEVAS